MSAENEVRAIIEKWEPPERFGPFKDKQMKDVNSEPSIRDHSGQG